MKKMPTTVVLMMFVAVRSPAIAVDQASQTLSKVQINATVLSFNCPNYTGHILYTLRSDTSSTDRHAMTTRIGASTYLLTFSVPPGHYQLFLDAEIPDKDDPSFHSALCETQQWFTALSDHDRHLVLVLGRVTIPHSNCSIAGSLPVDGLAVDLVLPKGHIRADSTGGGQLGPTCEDIDYGAVIDGLAYYIEHVPVDDFVLRFGNIEIPIDVTKSADVNIPYCHGEFRTQHYDGGAATSLSSAVRD